MSIYELYSNSNQIRENETYKNMVRILDCINLCLIVQDPENGMPIFLNEATSKMFSNLENQKMNFQIFLASLLDIGRSESLKGRYYDEINKQWYRVESSVLEWDNDTIVYLHTLTNITSMKQIEEQLVDEASKDKMTGVYNRSGGKYALQKYIGTMKDEQISSLCMIDLDGLKHVNDTYGHAAGDEFIRTFVQLMKETLTESHCISRMGGDEFLVLLPYTKKETEAVMHELELKTIEYNNMRVAPYQLSFSFGACEFSNKDRILGPIIEEADAEMYYYKKQKKKIQQA